TPTVQAGRSVAAARHRGPDRGDPIDRRGVRVELRSAPPFGASFPRFPGGPPEQVQDADRSGRGHAGPAPREGGRPGDDLVPPEAQRAIASGFDWLARKQYDDGSFGSRSYRRNVAVTSLSGLALMASGSSPRRGPYGASIDSALHFVL